MNNMMLNGLGDERDDGEIESLGIHHRIRRLQRGKCTLCRVVPDPVTHQRDDRKQH